MSDKDFDYYRNILKKIEDTYICHNNENVCYYVGEICEEEICELYMLLDDIENWE